MTQRKQEKEVMRKMTIIVFVFMVSLSVLVRQSFADEKDFCEVPIENGVAVTLTIGDASIPAVLNDTVSARDLISRLPYTVSLHRYSHDYCGVMSDPLDYDKADVRHGWKNGDIHFATDGPYFVLFFGDEENSKQYGNQVHIGVMDVDLEILRDLGGDIDVLIELAKD
jgi:hypothetical protein